MKRDILRSEKRAFVVEVKRGAKRPSTLDAPNPVTGADLRSDKLLRADKLLFGGDASPVVADSASPAPQRRILEAAQERISEPEAEVVEKPRRGRKPGSRNKPKPDFPRAAPVVKRGRGRPRRSPETMARQIAVTPELKKQALFQIAKANPPRPLSPAPVRREVQLPKFEAAPKRKRGRPRKVQGPQFDWKEWSAGSGAEPQEIVAAAEVLTQDIAAPALLLAPLSAAPLPASPRVRAGERWKRRLRIPALSLRRKSTGLKG